MLSIAPKVALSEANFGLYPMNNGLSRLATRFAGEQGPQFFLTRADMTADEIGFLLEFKQ